IPFCWRFLSHEIAPRDDVQRSLIIGKHSKANRLGVKQVVSFKASWLLPRCPSRLFSVDSRKFCAHPSPEFSFFTLLFLTVVTALASRCVINFGDLSHWAS